MNRPQMRSVFGNMVRTVAILSGAIVVCNALAQVFDDDNMFAPSVFMLAVVLTARFTEGYVYGIFAAAVGVVCVNCMFTYPFWAFNLTIAGYPLAFSVMLVVSIIVSTLTTRIKRQEQIRFEAERETVRANLLRSVAHDLRTPLASIMGASSALLQESSLSPEAREGLTQAIQKDAEWLMRVMENILSITKLSHGSVTLTKETEVVEEIVGSAIVKFHRIAGALPVTVHKPDEILLVPMEATLIEQVLINLFENVVAHGKTATWIHVQITKAHDRVVFAVEDNGVGIPDTMKKRIFEGNLPARTGPSDARRNMGIGLSVCRSILLAHGGNITAYDAPDGGAGIQFWLPYREDV